MNIGAEEVLRGYAVPVLKQMAIQAGLGIESTRKEPHIEALSRVLFDPQRIQRELAGLDPLERTVLDRLIERKGEASLPGLEMQVVVGEEEFGLPMPDPSSQRPYGGQHLAGNHPGSRRFVDVVARLTVKGLVFSRESREHSSVLANLQPASTLFIPDGILAHLPAPMPRRADWPAVEVSREQLASARAFQRDLFLYWSYLRWSPVGLTQRELVSKRDLARINAVLQAPEDLVRVRAEDEAGQVYFLRLVLLDAGLATVKNLHLVIGERSQEFFKGTLRARTQLSFDGWLRERRWNELLRIPGLSIDLGRNRDRRAADTVLEARHFVVEQLAGVPTGQWFALDRFIRRCRIANAEFLLPREHSTWYGITDPYRSYGNVLGWTFGVRNQEEGWSQVEGGFIRAVLAEPLHWLGLLDLGYQADRLIAARLTPLGAQVLGLAVEPEPEPLPGKLILQPNFHLLAIDPVGEYVLSVLDTFADRTRVDRAIEYTITRDSVYRAHQLGMEVNVILRFLEEECHTDVPQNVRRTLEEWGTEQERIVIRTGAALLQAADASLLDRLLVEPAIARHLARRVSPTVALVSPAGEALSEVSQALESIDLLLAVSRPGDVLVGAVVARPDGTLTFQHPVPSFAVQQRLAPFTEPVSPAPSLSTDEKQTHPVAPASPATEPGMGWAGEQTHPGKPAELRLTPDSIRRAVAGGMPVDHILQTLASVNTGPLPDALVGAIKGWGRYYGKVTIEETILLRVQDEAVLSELRNDPETRPLLKAFAPHGAVAVVKKGELERLRRALRERGIHVTFED